MSRKESGGTFHCPPYILLALWPDFQRLLSFCDEHMVGNTERYLLSDGPEVEHMTSRIFGVYLQGCLALRLIYLYIIGSFFKVTFGTCVLEGIETHGPLLH